MQHVPENASACIHVKVVLSLHTATVARICPVPWLTNPSDVESRMLDQQHIPSGALTFFSTQCLENMGPAVWHRIRLADLVRLRPVQATRQNGSSCLKQWRGMIGLFGVGQTLGRRIRRSEGAFWRCLSGWSWSALWPHSFLTAKRAASQSRANARDGPRYLRMHDQTKMLHNSRDSSYVLS